MSWSKTHKSIYGLLFASVVMSGGWAAFADETFGTPKSCESLLNGLDSNSWHCRTAAWEELCQQMQNSERVPEMLLAVRKELEKSDISYEVQEQLLLLEKELLKRASGHDGKESKTESAPALRKGTLEQLDCWRKLVSESPAARKQAERKVEQYLNVPDSAGEVMRILRKIITDDSIAADDRVRVWKLERMARKLWLEAGVEEKKESIFSESQIREWVAFLASANLPEDRLVPWMDFDERVTVQFSVAPYEDPLGGDGLTFLNFKTEKKGQTDGLKVWETVQLLEEALILESSASQTLQMINERLTAKDGTPAGTILLKRLAFLTKPCLAAEFWLGGEMRRSQFLRVGVPQNCGVGTSFFDALNEETVHCQGGTNLWPGDYRLGIAIRHPNQPTAFFHLTPLDSPLKKLLYFDRMKESGERWTEISRRTLEQMEEERAAQNRLLTLEEIRFLALLEPHEVSVWAGKWLNELKGTENLAQNTPAANTQPFVNALEEKQSFHADLCAWLMKSGTKEVMPGLISFLKKESSGEKEPTWLMRNTAKYRIAFLAALAITARDPWDGDEKWLKSLLSRDLNLIEMEPEEDDSPMVQAQKRKNLPDSAVAQSAKDENPAQIPLLSASAAGILKMRRKETLEGLVSVPFDAGSNLFYRFEDEKAKKRILEELLRE